MSEIRMFDTDQDAVNARILAREAKLDFRRVEAASIKVRTHLTSAEAKRLFVRTFQTLQLNAHFVSVIARSRLDHQHVEAVEATLRSHLEAVKGKLNDALDGAEALFKANGISSFATYDTLPLEMEVGLLSSSGRRYLEVFNQFDQLMPALQTLEIHDVISPQDLDAQRAALKRQIKDIATMARSLAGGLRKRMNAEAATTPHRPAAASADKSFSAEARPLPASVPADMSDASAVAMATQTAEATSVSSVSSVPAATEERHGPHRARDTHAHLDERVASAPNGEAGQVA